MLVAKLPGSTYAIAATNAGPSSGKVRRRRPRLESSWSRLGAGRAMTAPPAAAAGLERVEAVGVVLLDLELARRDRVAVRVARGVAELGGDQLLELLGQHVLEDLRLVVTGVPRDAERLREVELEQAVMPEHFEGELGPLLRELHAPVRDVAREAELVEALDHRRGGGGRHMEPLGNRVVRYGTLVLARERVDRLRVVLDGRRGRRSALDVQCVAPHSLFIPDIALNYGMPNFEFRQLPASS